MEKELHKIQMGILRSLLFKPNARFTDLNIFDISSDHFNFHVARLLEHGLIDKGDGDRYTLSNEGKQIAGRMDTATMKMEKLPKVSVLVVPVSLQDGKTSYLIHQRLKQPYYGNCGFMTGKIHYGETILEGAERELLEETGLFGKLIVVAVKHKMDYNEKEEILDDKILFVVRAEETKGNLLENPEEGKNSWLSKKEILALPNLFDGVEETINLVEKDSPFKFIESKYIVKGF